ncbi:STAS domain-containing protein [Saccharothrix isguenensis]
MDQQLNGNRPGISVGALEIGDVLVVQVSGEVDMSTVGVLQAEVTARLDARPAGFVLDLSGVDFFASVGVSLVAQVRQRAVRDDVTFAVVAWQRHVLQSLEVSGMNRVLPLFGTLTRALVAIPLHRAASTATTPGESVV